MVKMIYKKDEESISDDGSIPQKIVLNEITEQKTVYSLVKNN